MSVEDNFGPLLSTCVCWSVRTHTHTHTHTHPPISSDLCSRHGRSKSLMVLNIPFSPSHSILFFSLKKFLNLSGDPSWTKNLGGLRGCSVQPHTHQLKAHGSLTLPTVIETARRCEMFTNPRTDLLTVLFTKTQSCTGDSPAPASPSRARKCHADPSSILLILPGCS